MTDFQPLSYRLPGTILRVHLQWLNTFELPSGQSPESLCST